MTKGQVNKPKEFDNDKKSSLFAVKKPKNNIILYYFFFWLNFIYVFGNIMSFQQSSNYYYCDFKKINIIRDY